LGPDVVAEIRNSIAMYIVYARTWSSSGGEGGVFQGFVLRDSRRFAGSRGRARRGFRVLLVFSLAE